MDPAIHALLFWYTKMRSTCSVVCVMMNGWVRSPASTSLPDWFHCVDWDMSFWLLRTWSSWSISQLISKSLLTHNFFSDKYWIMLLYQFIISLWIRSLNGLLNGLPSCRDSCRIRILIVINLVCTLLASYNPHKRFIADSVKRLTSVAAVSKSSRNYVFSFLDMKNLHPKILWIPERTHM